MPGKCSGTFNLMYWGTIQHCRWPALKFISDASYMEMPLAKVPLCNANIAR